MRRSIQRLPVALDADGQHHRHEQRNRPQVRRTFGQAISLQQNAAHDAQKMRERQTFADVLRPARHPAKRKHIARQQQRWQEKEKRHLHRLQLVFGDGRERDAHREVRHDEQKRQRHQQRHAADKRHVEQEFRRQQHQRHLHIAHHDVGDDFADDDLAGMHGRGEQVFHRAALAFARDGQAGDDDHGHRQHYADEAGNDVVLADAFGIVMLVRDERERRRGRAQSRERPGEVAVDDGGGELAHRRLRETDGGRVGGVGFEEQLRLFTAQQLARKIHRHGHGKLHFPLGQPVLDFRRAVRFAREVEVAAVAQRPDDGARKRAVVRRINRRRQMLGIRVDGVAEQDELHHRDADHHAERQPVAPHLDELLHDDRPKTLEVETHWEFLR